LVRVITLLFPIVGPGHSTASAEGAGGKTYNGSWSLAMGISLCQVIGFARAAAVTRAMVTKSSAFRLAPPTSPPSISGCATNS
jgi:hypothetical protein